MFILVSLVIIALIYVVYVLVKDIRKGMLQKPEKSKKQFLLDMYMSHGWDQRKSMELSIKHCLDNEDKPLDSFWNTRENRWEWYDARMSLEKDLKEFDKVNTITLKHFPLSIKEQEVFKHHVWYDNRLKDSALKKSQELQDKDIETFKIINNVIITEYGYYVAVYEKVIDYSSTMVES